MHFCYFNKLLCLIDILGFILKHIPDAKSDQFVSKFIEINVP